jgi:hypothetical protein
MQVLIRRAQYEGFWGRIYYTLDARIEPTADEAELIARHAVASVVVFDSEQRKERMEAAQAHAEATRGQPLVRTGSSEEVFFGLLQDFASTAYNIGAGGYNLVLGSLEAHVTIQDLLDGAHLESDEAAEILDAERIIRGTIEFLQERLKDLATFDGREDFYETD